MIAIVEYDVATKDIKSVRYATDMVPGGNNDATSTTTRVMCVRLDASEPKIKEIASVLNNDPFSEKVQQSGNSTGDDLTVNKGILDEGTNLNVVRSPGARALTADELAGIELVRPAAHRAGQTTFFGNI